jgi:hypothetical protein
MTAPAIVGLVVLVGVAAACIAWITLDPKQIQAWTLLGQVVVEAGKLVSG